jgi:penicillin amidase
MPPGIILGATPHHAWGATNVTGDVQDLYEETLSDDGTAARYRDTWEPLVIHEERIGVRGEPEPRMVMVRETRHGPIVTHGAAGVLRTTYRHSTSRTRSGGPATRARCGPPGPSTSSALATSKGSARRCCRSDARVRTSCTRTSTARSPISARAGTRLREAGDGTRPVPGWTGEHEWLGWIPLDELPHEINPDRGFIATANDDIQPEGYPYLIAKDFHLPFRKRRIDELLEARDHSRRVVDAGDPAGHGREGRARDGVTADPARDPFGRAGAGPEAASGVGRRSRR